MKPAVVFLLALALAVTGGCRNATPDKTVKVGIILTYSGPDASIGESIDRAAELYVKLHGHELPEGVRLELVKRDETGPTPDVAKRLARELIVRDKIQILSGGQWTPNVSAIAPLATEAKIPYVLMGSGTASTTRLSPYIARVAFTQWQQSYHLGQWAAKSGIKNAYTIVTDYASGVDAETAFTRGFKESGGTIVGSVRVPLRSPDYVPFLERIRREKPQALYAFNPGGPEATKFIKAYNDVGLAAANIALIGPAAIMPDDELPNMGDGALDVVTASHYSASADRPANRVFIEEWHKAYGPNSLPGLFAVGGWDGMAAIFEVIRRQNGEIDSERTMEILKGWSNPDSPRGPVEIDPKERDLIQNIYIRRVQNVDGRLQNIEFATIPAVKDPWKELNPS